MDRAPALWVGIDLAWGTRNPSGLTMLEWREDGLAEVEPTQLVYTDEEICRVIAEQDAGNTLVIAVDAPLVVPNLTGERPVEGEMRRRFARYHAACHPANRRLLGEPPRGERLCAMLAERLNVEVAPAPPVRQACRVAFEVYPHAAMVRLFHLPRILEYKARSGRDMAYRRGQMQRYVGLLKQLPAPKLYLPALAVGEFPKRVPNSSASRTGWMPCSARGWRRGRGGTAGRCWAKRVPARYGCPTQDCELPTENIEAQP
jgi:predicted RNase H-like nuclease